LLPYTTLFRSSHDTPRVLTEARGEIDLMLIALTLQMTLPGAPMIYYGDEVGMLGGHDPDCRRCMSWDESDWNHTLLGATRSLIALRARHPALRHGNFQPLASFNGVCVYTMEMGEDAVIVVVNPREAVRDLTIPLQTHGVNWSEVFT